MQLVINKENLEREFVEYLANEYIPSLILNNNLDKLSDLGKELDIDFYNAFTVISKSIVIEITSTNYIIKFNKNIIYKGISVEKLVNISIYGTRTSKGYPLIQKVFDFIAKNINMIYRDWSE